MDELNFFLKGLITRNISSETWKWLEAEVQIIQQKAQTSKKLNIAFVAMPRKTGKALVNISPAEEKQIKSLRPDLVIGGWSIDRLCRVWLLMQVDASDKKTFVATVENLFQNAEMSEQVALYSALPVLAHPELWRKRCAEGIRSNIGQVLESIICNNPYPAENLDAAAWNQLVLKAIFTEKPMLHITGLLKRRNQDLANSLSDYAHERWAAHRSVNPLLWMCVSPFINEKIFPDIQRIISSENPLEREAAVLASFESSYGPAKTLVEQDPGLKSSILKGELTWASVAREMENVEK